MTRRTMLTACAAVTVPSRRAAGRTKMTIQLDSGAIGVKARVPEALAYAARFGFESITADSAWLASQSESGLATFLDEMKAKGVVWGSAGLPVDFRGTEELFRKGMAELPERAAALKRAGAVRVSTWLSPAHDSATYLENFRLHARRLREVASLLGDHGCRLGLEYVGPKTSWTARRYAFVHTMKEMKELIAEIGKPNVGFLLDSWHWYTAGETVADLQTLKPSDVVSVDLNDAPVGLALDQQKDNQREIPCATGVIPVSDFLNALNKLGCDAPVRCEPFNAPLRAMTPEQALETVAAAMKKAFGLIA
ncbi:MAG: sugar phosphate isomerase/epimerase [Candidatus Solibacter usitatus]|nr:sugar phosphate isomerase/epimerase [Candidatus Solibacter usitatus]